MTVAVLTGASRGIGRATAVALADRSCDLALPGRPSRQLSDTLELVRARGVRAEQLDCDLLDPVQIDQAARHVLDRLGPPDVVLNNAGIVERATVHETSLESWDRQLSVNLRAPFLLVRALLPAMRAAGRGRIVNVGSISSTIGSARSAAYNASKWGLVGFSKSLAEELAGSGLMSVAVLPGSVDTSMLEGGGFAPRMTPEDVAATLVHYSLDASLAHNGGVVEMFGV